MAVNKKKIGVPVNKKTKKKNDVPLNKNWCVNFFLFVFSDSLAAFTPRNVKLYSFDEPPAGVYIAWDPPLNSKLLHKSSDLSRNVANAKNDVNATLNRLSVPLHHPTGSNSDPHPQYILNEDSHELTNTSHVSADLFEMNSTKNLTRIGDDQSKISVLENVIYDVYGFINNYIVFYRRQQDSGR